MPPECRAREEVEPAAWMQACGRSLISAERFSCAPLGEPGRVITTVLLQTPATGRAIIATAACQSGCTRDRIAI